VDQHVGLLLLMRTAGSAPAATRVLARTPWRPRRGLVGVWERRPALLPAHQAQSPMTG
jgi:hypothetical protein